MPATSLTATISSRPNSAPPSREAPWADRWRRAVTGDTKTPLVIIGNFEVEERWARGEIGLPRLTSEQGSALVNRLDELALLLGRPGDTVVVKTLPSPALLDHLVAVGLELPAIIAPDRQRPEHSVSQDVLADQGLLDRLSVLGAAGHHLVAHGVSDLEEQIAQRTGLALSGADAEALKKVNSKVWSRRLADAHGVAQPQGYACSSLAELQECGREAEALLEHGPVVVKEALGVSGKGLAVVETPARLQRLLRLIARRVTDPDQPIGFCIEQWLEKDRDFNYQFTLDSDGGLSFDVVKEALTAGGVHQGHRMPAGLSPDELDLLRGTADTVGAALAEEHYVGVVGIDALTTTDGTLYPLIEVNARHNMSTYQMGLQERILTDGQVGLARHYPVVAKAPVPFEAVQRALGDRAYDPGRGSGVVVQNFATVNAAFAVPGQPGVATPAEARGRLYAFLVGDDVDEVSRLDAWVVHSLEQMGDQLA